MINTMAINTGRHSPGIPTVNKKSHLGDLILKKYGDVITGGKQDLKDFELIDGLSKPAMSFEIRGDKELMLDVHEFLGQSPYAFAMSAAKGQRGIESFPDEGDFIANVFVSRFPDLIEFVKKHERDIPVDLYGLLFGYPVLEIHQFAYDWTQWKKNFWPRVEVFAPDVGLQKDTP
jgi:hypothetical protein